MAHPRFPIVLYPKRASALLYFAVCGLVLALLLWTIVTGQLASEAMSIRVVLYVFTVLTGLGLLVFFVQLFPGSTFLRIDESGFTFSVMFRETSFLWEKIESFSVIRLSQRGTGVTIKEMVGFNVITAFKQEVSGSALSQSMSGCDAALPDLYGKPVAELTDLMNECLLQARQRR